MAGARCLLSSRASLAEQNPLFGLFPVGNPCSAPGLNCPEQGSAAGAQSTPSCQTAPGDMWKKDVLLLKMWPQGALSLGIYVFGIL